MIENVIHGMLLSVQASHISHMPVYSDLKDINRLQQSIMHFVDVWAREKKTPIPQKEIIGYFEREGVKSFTTVFSLNTLLKKGYIRRACTISNKTFYVQLRRV